MAVLEQVNDFAERWRKQLIVNSTTWRYSRFGAGAPIPWLSGGLRLAALGFRFLERLATRHTIIAPDYPPV